MCCVQDEEMKQKAKKIMYPDQDGMGPPAAVVSPYKTLSWSCRAVAASHMLRSRFISGFVCDKKFKTLWLCLLSFNQLKLINIIMLQSYCKSLY